MKPFFPFYGTLIDEFGFFPIDVIEILIDPTWYLLTAALLRCKDELARRYIRFR
jgi:hypothetical protein